MKEKNIKTETETEIKEANTSKEKTVEELKAEIDSLKNDYLRARADYDNLRKRYEKESFEIRENAVNNFVLDLLPSIDNFELSLKMTDNNQMFIKGVEMIHQNLIRTLMENHYSEFMPEIGEEFDPEKHDPILTESSQENHGKIIEVVKKGYNKHDKIIRPARVKIGKFEEKEEQTEK